MEIPRGWIKARCTKCRREYVFDPDKEYPKVPTCPDCQAVEHQMHLTDGGLSASDSESKPAAIGR